jgi:hypothetical protein
MAQQARLKKTLELGQVQPFHEAISSAQSHNPSQTLQFTDKQMI